MRKFIGLLGVALALTACGGNSPGKSRDEAVADFREQSGVSSRVSDEDIRDLMWTACETLDKERPGKVMDDLSDIPRPVLVVVLNNATQAFCPEHREAVVDYLKG